MTDIEMRIKIAEACGWKHHHMRPSETERHQKKWRYLSDLPDYLNDLNAMHEAEKTLLKMDGCQAHWETYSNILTMKVGCEDIFHATTRQRAEAFIKTLNLEPK